MNVTNENGYKYINHYDIARELKQFFKKNNCSLTDEQENIIHMYWGTLGNKNLNVYKCINGNNDYKGIGWRLTLPLYLLLCLIIILIFYPIYWLTGKTVHSIKFLHFMDKWGKKILKKN
jgi:hypothetical protein